MYAYACVYALHDLPWLAKSVDILQQKLADFDHCLREDVRGQLQRCKRRKHALSFVTFIFSLSSSGITSRAAKILFSCSAIVGKITPLRARAYRYPVIVCVEQGSILTPSVCADEASGNHSSVGMCRCLLAYTSSFLCGWLVDGILCLWCIIPGLRQTTSSCAVASDTPHSYRLLHLDTHSAMEERNGKQHPNRKRVAKCSYTIQTYRYTCTNDGGTASCVTYRLSSSLTAFLFFNFTLIDDDCEANRRRWLARNTLICTWQKR